MDYVQSQLTDTKKFEQNNFFRSNLQYGKLNVPSAGPFQGPI